MGISCRPSDGDGASTLIDPVDNVRLYVENILPQFDALLHQHTREELIYRAMRTYIAQETERVWRERVQDGLRYVETIDAAYASLWDETMHARIFTDNAGMSVHGEVVWDRLTRAHEHALNGELFQKSRISALKEEFLALHEELDLWEPITLRAEEVEELVQWLHEHVAIREPLRLNAAIMDALTKDREPDSASKLRLNELRKHIADFRERYQPAALLAAQLEARLADGALRYARDMKHFNVARYDWRELRDAGGSANIILARLKVTLEELFAAKTIPEVEAVFDALLPRHPQYSKLYLALSKYRAFAEHGDWPRVRPVALTIGERSAQAARLRHRLTREGYLDRIDNSTNGEGIVWDDRVDEELIEALKDYQRARQLPIDGQLSTKTVRSLNISVAARIEQIELTMQRWRESLYDGEGDFIFVNIPDFHAEIYSSSERQMRFRVVVGKADRVCDKETKTWTYPNLTPIQKARMDHLMLNPAWYVPSRLVREVIEPRIKDDPEWPQANGYEQIQLQGGRTAWRQLPGEDNALGKAKFIFPNPHNTYMHDTPHKHLFEHDVRAFSYGCVRVENPIALAKYLVEWDGQGASVDVDTLLESERTIQIKMTRDLPVFTEYYTVRVDDDQRVVFLTDIYRLDARRQSDDVDEFDRCRVSTTRRITKRTVQDSDADAISVDLSVDLGP